MGITHGITHGKMLKMLISVAFAVALSVDVHLLEEEHASVLDGNACPINSCNGGNFLKDDGKNTCKCQACKTCGASEWKKENCKEKVDTDCQAFPTGHTIDKGATWETPTKAADYEAKANCRCLSGSGESAKALSICNKGCGDPSDDIKAGDGCVATDIKQKDGSIKKLRRCGHGCTVKPKKNRGGHAVSKDHLDDDAHDGDPTMTYYECQAQCAIAGMKLPKSEDDIKDTKNTGCNINGKKMWVDTN